MMMPAETVTTVMTEYFDTDRPADEWFAALEPHLSTGCPVPLRRLERR